MTWGLKAIKGWFMRKPVDTSLACEAYEDFRQKIHKSRNLAMEASGSSHREMRAAERMIQVAEDAIAEMEKQRDGDV